MNTKRNKASVRVISIESLSQEHQELERRLDRLNRRGYLTPAEQIERKTIQKLKLLKKDQIAVLTRMANA